MINIYANNFTFEENYKNNVSLNDEQNLINYLCEHPNIEIDEQNKFFIKNTYIKFLNIFYQIKSVKDLEDLIKENDIPFSLKNNKFITDLLVNDEDKFNNIDDLLIDLSDLYKYQFIEIINEQSKNNFSSLDEIFNKTFLDELSDSDLRNIFFNNTFMKDCYKDIEDEIINKSIPKKYRKKLLIEYIISNKYLIRFKLIYLIYTLCEYKKIKNKKIQILLKLFTIDLFDNLSRSKELQKKYYSPEIKKMFLNDINILDMLNSNKMLQIRLINIYFSLNKTKKNFNFKINENSVDINYFNIYSKDIKEIFYNHENNIFLRYIWQYSSLFWNYKNIFINYFEKIQNSNILDIFNKYISENPGVNKSLGFKLCFNNDFTLDDNRYNKILKDINSTATLSEIKLHNINILKYILLNIPKGKRIILFLNMPMHSCILTIENLDIEDINSRQLYIFNPNSMVYFKAKPFFFVF